MGDTPQFASFAEIATRDGVTRQAVSKNARQFVGEGLGVERDDRGRIVRVDVAAYDRMRLENAGRGLIGLLRRQVRAEIMSEVQPALRMIEQILGASGANVRS
jgi:hypothetical protein